MTRCENHSCPLKHKCERYASAEAKTAYWVATFVPDTVASCSMFRAVKPAKKTGR